jgi:hypothetical protein
MEWNLDRVPPARGLTGRDEEIVRFAISAEHSGLERNRLKRRSVRSQIGLPPSLARTALFTQLVSGSTMLAITLRQLPINKDITSEAPA